MAHRTRAKPAHEHFDWVGKVEPVGNDQTNHLAYLGLNWKVFEGFEGTKPRFVPYLESSTYCADFFPVQFCLASAV